MGPTRSGKSALLGLIMSQFLRYAQSQIFCFDKDRALYACTVLAGGTHYDFGHHQGLGIQPLGRLHEGDQEQRWAVHWLGALLQSQGLALSPEDREQLWLALGRLTTFPQPMRTLSGYAECLQVQRLKRGLTPFLQGGPYAFLDAAHDDIALQDFTTFEMRRLLDLPEVLPHVLRYVFHRISERFNGRQTLIILDEARKLLADATFGPEILDMLKERAKMGVSAILAVQEIFDAATSPAWHAILGSCRTFLYLPNPAATNREVAAFYKDCGLSDHEIQLLALSTPKQDYLYKSDRNVRRFQLVLSHIERLLVAASTPEEIQLLQSLMQEELKEPLVSAWLRNNGMGHEAEIFMQYYNKEI
jgi:type IV secretion system protein VirB4